MPRTNQFGQPIGPDLGDWSAAEFPPPDVLIGHHVKLEPLDAEAHAPGLYSAFREAPPTLWTYLPYGPLRSVDETAAMIDSFIEHSDWVPYAMVIDSSPLGFASYLRIDPAGGVIEIGAITYALALQRTTAATETLRLLIGHAFDLGYRRCEWKCDDLNEPSRAAADRLGFLYEGTFRNATHYKGRSRDTAWFSITADEWVHLEPAFDAWLSSENFDPEGQQRRSLSELRTGC